MAGETGNDDAAWRDLVARYGAAAQDAPPWPDQEDLPGEDDGPTWPPPPAWPGQIRIIRPAAATPGDGFPRLPESDDEHFVPPPPPPLPRLDPVTKGAWAALFCGPGYLLLAVMLGWTIPGWAGFTAIAAFVGGFAVLVVRMGERPEDTGSDDGAVV